MSATQATHWPKPSGGSGGHMGRLRDALKCKVVDTENQQPNVIRVKRFTAAKVLQGDTFSVQEKHKEINVMSRTELISYLQSKRPEHGFEYTELSADSLRGCARASLSASDVVLVPVIQPARVYSDVSCPGAVAAYKLAAIRRNLRQPADIRRFEVRCGDGRPTYDSIILVYQDILLGEGTVRFREIWNVIRV